MSSLTRLRILSVQCTDLADGAVQQLVCSLAHLPALTDVTIGCEWPASMADAELQACFGALASVTSLDVSARFALRAGLVSGVAALTQLHALNIWHRTIDMGAALALRGALPALQLLKHFSMANCQCMEGMGEIMAGLCSVTGLEKLDLSGNDLSPETADEVAEALRALSHLQTINLPHTKTKREIQEVWGALHGTKGLLRVDLSLTYPFPEDWAAGVELLIDLINASESLRCVELDFKFERPLYDVITEIGALEHCLDGVAMKDPLRLLDLRHYVAELIDEYYYDHPSQDERSWSD